MNNTVSKTQIDHADLVHGACTRCQGSLVGEETLSSGWDRPTGPPCSAPQQLTSLDVRAKSRTEAWTLREGNAWGKSPRSQEGWVLGSDSECQPWKVTRREKFWKLMTMANLCHGCDWASCPRKSVPDATLLKDWSPEYASTQETLSPHWIGPQYDPDDRDKVGRES